VSNGRIIGHGYYSPLECILHPFKSASELVRLQKELYDAENRIWRLKNKKDPDYRKLAEKWVEQCGTVRTKYNSLKLDCADDLNNMIDCDEDRQ
jgi:hypothetical protein